MLKVYRDSDCLGHIGQAVSSLYVELHKDIMVHLKITGKKYNT